MILIEPLLIAWMIIYFEPLQSIVLKSNNKLVLKLSCFKCVSFWVSIIWMLVTLKFNIFSAIINSIIGYLFEKIDNSIGTKI